MKSHSHSHTHTHTHMPPCPSRLSTAKVTDITLSVPLRPAQAGREALSWDSGSGRARLHLCAHENHPGGKVASDTMALKVTRITPAHTACVSVSPQAVSSSDGPSAPLQDPLRPLASTVPLQTFLPFHWGFAFKSLGGDPLSLNFWLPSAHLLRIPLSTLP